ncbi:MAG: sugar phosphate isomerase/epimerase [Clostridia bacterium]|nr:sugar phosphate isomerase/epimerase [Clostridia bacterium]
MKAGLNLFSLRNFVSAGEEVFTETLIKLKNMGYEYMQYSGGPIDADMLARVSKNSGLPFILTHAPMSDIIGDTENLMEKHAKFGCKNIGLGMIPTDIIFDKEKCYDTIDKLNKAGEIMAKNGFKFCYHHHHFEFYKHDGKTVFDYMIENAPYINFTADTYWLQFGGVDILSTLEKIKGRIECVHLKDYQIFANSQEFNGFTPRFAPVGKGNINYPVVIEKMRECGTKYFLVEQDDAPTYPDPLGQVEMSINYLKELK